MDFYVNPRIANVRVVQYTIAVGAVGIALIAVSDGALSLALILAAIGAACVVAFELLYIRKYVTRIRRDQNGWVLSTLSTFGERQLAFDPAQVQLGEEIEEYVRFSSVNYHYPLRIGATRYILDTTPPAKFDREALERALRR